jgi:acyl-CoA synthetase (AMP-forming)/AMP-acid ligase II
MDFAGRADQTSATGDSSPSGEGPRPRFEIDEFQKRTLIAPAKAAVKSGAMHPQLTSYKRPSEIIVLDALPATSTGKILEHKLAECLRGAWPRKGSRGASSKATELT